MNSTPLPSPLLALVRDLSPRAEVLWGTIVASKKAPSTRGPALSAPGMSQPLTKRTPLANDPVGSLVGEFMEEKRREIQEEKARQVSKKRNPLVIPIMIVLTAFIWIAPSMMPPREPAITQETLEKSAKLTLYLASIRVKGYLATHKRLPPNLTQAGVDTTGIDYTRSSDSVFELATRVQGTRIVFRSTVPDSVFLGKDTRIRGIS